MDFAGSPRLEMTAREQGARHPGKGRGDLWSPLTTEKMLSANRKMSNIFLQRGQNIDIADKNRARSRGNFGSLEGLTFYLA
jgi:hypothetical protein